MHRPIDQSVAAPVSETGATGQAAALALLNRAALRLAASTAALAAGEALRFDGLPSRLARATLCERALLSAAEALAGHRIGGRAALWHVPAGGYLLPRRLPGRGSRARIIPLAAADGDGITIARPGDVRCHAAAPGAPISLDGDGWYWISPATAALNLVGLELDDEDAQAAGPAGACPPPLAPARIRAGLLRNAAEIAGFAREEAARFRSYPRRPPTAPFDPWRGSEYEDDDRYHVLPMQDMSPALRRLTAAALAPLIPPGRRLYFQINRYDQGDHVLPHRDDFPQGFCVLAGDAGDGLVVQSGGSFVRLPDAAGAAVMPDPRAWHWVDPVRRGPRFSLVTIPPLDFGTAP